MYHDMARAAGIVPLTSMQIVVWQFITLVTLGLGLWVATRFDRTTRAWGFLACLALPGMVMFAAPATVLMLGMVPFINIPWALVMSYNIAIDPHFTDNLLRAAAVSGTYLLAISAISWAQEMTTKFFRRGVLIA